MGVPKFYRWISERYPNMSRVVNDNQIPDFDNFYLDMNGIIHQCSHVNEDNCETNVTEEEIFRNIFHYLDFLFRMIKPKKVFFMAIDGVAPRAKMNQQRARRFRAGKDRMKKLKILAEKTGKTLDETAAKHFDTNAITPGTQFMANLHEQLKYFIHVKLTTDPLWENVDVHLSGHSTPGEGEHKIMDYIRYTRSQPGYNVNTRHCLYGLDADLIMLGLVTHEMHFALLREEVKYGSKKVSKILAPEEITWHLLHTCLLRDYIDLEFRSLRENQLKFPYDLDHIVDDWILMAYLVGNDFIPHLPHIHINEEALSLLWDTYKKILPTLDGYLNESGELNLTRFEIYLTELSKFDRQRFSHENDSFKHLSKINDPKKNSSRTKSQSNNDDFDFSILDKLTLPPTETVNSTEQKPVDIGLSSDENDHSSSSSTISGESDDDEDDEIKISSKLINEDDLDTMPLAEAEFRQHKNHYYRDKMELESISSEQIQKYAEEYIEALQWILKYYYQGCPSWSWFYPFHYAPYLSDLKNFNHSNKLFHKGTPFKPFEQLLGVLPPTSRQLLPDSLQSLMIASDSPLLHFYPEHFRLDQNEKKKDWEAIVLLPFIDEQLLLSSITKFYNQLNSNEQFRNQHLPSLCFNTTLNLQPIGNSLATNTCFPPLKETRATCREFPVDYYHIDISQVKYNRFDEKDMINFPKFPILNVLPYKFAYKTSAVNLFEMRSKSTTLVLSLTNQSNPDCIKYNNQWNPKDENPSIPFQITNIHLLIERYLGKCVFVNWPHFQYGIVCGISDYRHVYTWTNIPGGANFYSPPVDPEENRNITQTPIYVSYYPFEISNDSKKATSQTIKLNEIETQMEYTKALNINRNYENQQGVTIGPIPILLYVSPLIGFRTKCSSTTNKCRTMMCFSNQALAYPLQTTLFKIPNYKSNIEQIPQTIEEYFQINDPIFALQSPYYSSLGYVQKINKIGQDKYTIACQMESSDVVNQPDIHNLAPKLNGYELKYFTAQQIAARLKISPSVISKVTGKVNIIGGNQRRRRVFPTNIGLLWKVNKPVKQLYGYTKKIDQVWYYSETAISVISEYISKFPEVVREIETKPKDDTYYEANIWPENKGKHELQKIRIWIKSLPTYSIPLTDAAWKVLDVPVITEIEKSVKTYYTKQAAKNTNKKVKTASLDPSYVFKSNELLGMCDPDAGTQFYLCDRVVNVRLGTGVPIGTRGTIVGIMLGRTNLDTYYEVLFDNLPSNSLEAILLGKNQQKCRIKVHSYHLLNYSHSLRLRSNNYAPQRSVPAVNMWEQNLEQQKPRAQPQQQQQQQQYHNYKKESGENNNTSTKPKSAPPLSAHNRPYFVEDKQGKSTNSGGNVAHAQTTLTSANNPVPTETLLLSNPANSGSEALFFRAIQDSEQIQNPLQHVSDPNSSITFQSSDTVMCAPQTWATASSQYLPMNENISQMSSYPIEQQQSSMYMASQYQPMSPTFQPGMQQFNPMAFDPTNGMSIFPPQGFPIPGYPIMPMGTPIPVNYEQQQQTPSTTTRINQFATSPSSLSYDAQPFEPQQTPPPRPTNKETLQFIPSQVLRNIPKK